MNTITHQTDYMGVIKHQYHRFTSWIRSKFKRTEEKPKAVRLKREYEDIPTQFRTIKGLLGSLDETFKNLKLMTPKKNEFQRIIKRFGAYVSSPRHHISGKMKLEGFKSYGLPSFLCNYMPGGHDLRDIDGVHGVDNFFCATKKTRVTGLVCDSKKYVYYECADVGISDKKKVQDLAYVIAVDKKTGEVNPLKYPYIVGHSVGTGHKRDTYHTKEWKYPDYRSKRSIRDDDAIEGYSEELKVARSLVLSFIQSYNTTMYREYGVNIIVKKGKHRATFTVPQDRWKYFFRERVKAKNRNGNTKPIFHSVSAHGRVTAKGTVAVKTHYRGLRNFSWGGYQISIVMQGKHGVSQASFGATGIEEEDMETGVKYYGTDDICDGLNDAFEHGYRQT